MYYAFIYFFFFNDTATTEIYTLSLHDALPISSEALRSPAISPWPSRARPGSPGSRGGPSGYPRRSRARPLPVVACRGAAVPEIVEGSRTGLLVSPGSPDELAMAMEKLLVNEGLRKDFGAAGAQRVEAVDLRS